ncbi:MAG TPA: tetratricopeptide repeat protein [Steroidobacteraceae bacterium]|nr:tetratricopeptide repeat protein [Steroidobacteraceae bacterium]
MARNSRWSRLAAVCAAIAVAAALPSVSDAQLAKPKKKRGDDTEQQAASGAQYSDGFRKQASKVEPLVKDKKWDEVLAALPALEAIPDKTPDDDRAIATWRLQASQGSGDKELLAAAVENFLAKGYADASQLSSMHQLLAAHYNNKKDREKALHHYRQFVDATPDIEPDEIATLGRLYRQNSQFAEAAQAITRAIELTRSRGERPSEELYVLRDDVLFKLENSPERLTNLVELISDYPDKKYYSNVVRLMQILSQDDRVVMLNAYRVAASDPLGGFDKVGDYLGYADAALISGSPGEASRGLERGMKDGVVPGVGTNQTLLQEAKAAVAADQKTLAAEAAAAAKSAKGDVSVKVGLGFYSTGNYEKAAELVRQGIAKGGVTRADDANLLLGAALMELGRREEARSAFDAALGGAANPQMAGIARLWLARVARDAAPAPAGG